MSPFLFTLLSFNIWTADCGQRIEDCGQRIAGTSWPSRFTLAYVLNINGSIVQNRD